jgi:hypothetical protein
VAMTAADEVCDARAAVTARVAVLKQLGFEEALRGLLQVHRGRSVEGQGALAAAAGAGARAASPAAAAAAGHAVAVSSEANSQDLIERVRTALQQLGVGER